MAISGSAGDECRTLAVVPAPELLNAVLCDLPHMRWPAHGRRVNRPSLERLSTDEELGRAVTTGGVDGHDKRGRAGHSRGHGPVEGRRRRARARYGGRLLHRGR